MNIVPTSIPSPSSLMASVSLQLCFLLFCVVHFGRVQVLVRSDDVKIWVNNLWANTVTVKVRNSYGEVAIQKLPRVRKEKGESSRRPQVKKEKVEVADIDLTQLVLPRYNEKMVTLASSSRAYTEKRPWFLWLKMVFNSSSSFQFLHYPLVESPSYIPGTEMSSYRWEVYGKGIFFTQIEKDITHSPTQLCSWDGTAATSSYSSEPYFKPSGTYTTRNPLHPCSVYSGSSNPAWISVVNELAKSVLVTVRKGDDETSTLMVGVSAGSAELPSYGDGIISASHEDYGKHKWTMVVRVQGDDPLRNFDVTLIKRMESDESAAGTEGWVMQVKERGIFFLENRENDGHGDYKTVCRWKGSLPNCHNDGHAFSI